MSMKLIVRIIFGGLIAGLNVLFVSGQHSNSVYENYIRQYSTIAVEEEKVYHLPASITLAQALLESAAGRSFLAKYANNHFGIKCSSDWAGDRINKDADAPNECFRKYNNVIDSYKDHSLFLTTHSRYASLFMHEPSDYRNWAVGLQTCKYATDVGYANKLIKLIETYELYLYHASGEEVDGTETVSAKTNTNYSTRREIFKTHGLIYVIARENDSFKQIADDLGFKAKKLIKYNEVPKDFPLQKGDIVYLEKKKKTANEAYTTHQVKVGESMHSISQRYGMYMKELYKLNKKDKDYVPEEGDILKLR